MGNEETGVSLGVPRQALMIVTMDFLIYKAEAELLVYVQWVSSGRERSECRQRPILGGMMEGMDGSRMCE